MRTMLLTFAMLCVACSGGGTEPDYVDAQAPKACRDIGPDVYCTNGLVCSEKDSEGQTRKCDPTNPDSLGPDAGQ